MNRFFGIIGIIVIFAICFLMSNNKKKISLKTVLSGFGLQILLAIFVLKTKIGQIIFAKAGQLVEKLLDFANQGGDFVFGSLTNNPQKWVELFGAGGDFIFALKLIPTIIFVLIIVNILYHVGIMQKIVYVCAKVMYKIMNISGSEALSNAASAFVGQVEAQIMIKPYLATMTMSELLASMTGSMACIAGGVMAMYIGMGIPAEYLLSASIMAAPGALVISKIVFPETEESQTKDDVKIEVKQTYVNLIDAIAHGASDGMRVSINVIAMLIALIALIHMVDWVLGYIGLFLVNICHLPSQFLGIDFANLSMKEILGAIFSVFAFIMGVPFSEASTVGSLMGTKLVFNEFIAYMDLSQLQSTLSAKSVIIASFALCGFANLGSIAIQIGGIGELAPTRRKDLAKLGFKALICGTLASYVSACIAGILL
ncbi:NupC/NupG family nucleoside CNT transporter [bacterium]|nr:NupC/NupG family nucleoside CNT transporter [bacterium]